MSSSLTIRRKKVKVRIARRKAKGEKGRVRRDSNSHQFKRQLKALPIKLQTRRLLKVAIPKWLQYK